MKSREPIELAIDSPDGVIDCRVEWVENEGAEGYYSVTILYPNMAGGMNRSEIFCYDMIKDKEAGGYSFRYGDEGIHPKIGKLEAQLSAAIEASHIDT